VRRPAAASLTAATGTTLMLLRPTHSRVIMPAAITGRDLNRTVQRHARPHGRAMAQGGPHQEAMAISLSSSVSHPFSLPALTEVIE
jgi:hypothetical protein